MTSLPSPIAMKVALLLLAVLAPAAVSAAQVPPPLTAVPPIIDDLVALLMAVVEHIYEWVIAHLFPGMSAEQHAAAGEQLLAAARQQAPQLVEQLQQQLGVSRQELGQVLRLAASGVVTPAPRLLAVLLDVLRPLVA